MKSWLTVILACLLSAGIGFMGGRASLDRPPVQSASLLPPAPMAPDAIRLARAPAPEQAAPAAAKPAGTQALNLLRVALATQGDHAEACLVFSAPISRAPDFHVGDFLRIEPAARTAMRIDGERICLGGLDFATAYKVTALAGLPGDDGSRMLADETLPLSLGDLPQTADFADDGFILARGSAQGLPMATVNTKTLHMRVDRITDRVLVRTELGRGYQDNDGDGGDTLGVRLWEGDLAIAPGRNEKMTTAFPLDQVLDHRLPGAYRITLVNKHQSRTGYAYEDNKYRWVFNTDLMLTSHKGADGLHVFVRSLATAKPLRGTQVALLAANNDELGRAETNADGQAVFPAACCAAARASFRTWSWRICRTISPRWNWTGPASICRTAASTAGPIRGRWTATSTPTAASTGPARRSSSAPSCATIWRGRWRRGRPFRCCCAGLMGSKPANGAWSRTRSAWR